MFRKLVTLSVVAFCFFSCGIRKNILYDSLSQRAAIPEVTRIYIDRNGNLYPDAQTGIAFWHSDLESLLRDSSDIYTGLENYFRPNSHLDQFRQILNSYHVQYSSSMTLEQWGNNWRSLWTESQRRIRERIISNVHIGLHQSDSGTPLVVLVHGFNAGVDGDPTNMFTFVRNYIQAHYFPTTRIHFLEVYWDGVARKAPLFIWGASQRNSYLAGMSLRPILTSISKYRPLRIISHSLGANVICSALWNNFSSMDTTKDDPELPLYLYRIHHNNGEFSLPTNKDIRVGLIAPAIPATPFCDYQTEYERGQCPLYDRIVAGTAKRDFANRKIYFAETFWWLGKTSLGYAKRSQVRNFLGNGTYNCEIVDLRNYQKVSVFLPRREQHGPEYYLNYSPNSKIFMDRVFTQ